MFLVRRSLNAGEDILPTNGTPTNGTHVRTVDFHNIGGGWRQAQFRIVLILGAN